MPLAIESDVVITQKYLPSLSFPKRLLFLSELSHLQNCYKETYCIICSRWPPKSIFVVAMGCYILLTSASPSQRERLRISTVEGEGPISSHGLQCVTKTWQKQFPQIIALFQSLIIFYKYILVPGINLSNSVINRNRHHVSSSITVLLCLLFLAATFLLFMKLKKKSVNILHKGIMLGAMRV